MNSEHKQNVYISLFVLIFFLSIFALLLFVCYGQCIVPAQMIRQGYVVKYDYRELRPAYDGWHYEKAKP